jgi:hypothetical protein
MVNSASFVSSSIDGFNKLRRNPDCSFNDPDPHAFIDTGVKKNNKTINRINLNGGIVEIKETQTLNPFFTGIDGGSVLSLSNRELQQNYNHLYIMCLKDDIKDKDQDSNPHVGLIMNVFSKIVDKQTLINSCKNFTVVKMSTNLLRNYYLKKRANLVEGNILNIYFPYPIDHPAVDQPVQHKYDIDEIIIPMFELTETKVRLYVKMYGNNVSLQELNNMLSLASHYNKFNNLAPIDSQITEYLSNFDSSPYWKNPKNCNFNMDEMFCMRSLSYNGHRLDQIRYATISGAKTLNNLLTSLNKTRPKNYVSIKTDTSYHLNDINEKSNKNPGGDLKAEHMNIYQVFKTAEKRTFYATMDYGQFGFTKDEIADTFDRITDEKYRFNLLNSLLVSKDYCHFVINNRRVLQRNSDLFERYKPFYAYWFGYAWVTFYLEESIFTTRSTKKNRFVYDIDTARELPLFPFSKERIHNNPYVTLLLSNDLIDPSTNCMSVDSLHDYKKYYGLTTREDALKRFNCFSSGKSDVNIFKGLDPKIFSFSGSIMPACLQKRSPLLDLCTSDDMSFDDKYGTFFTHYFGEADIDVMCSCSSTVEFLTHATTLINQLVQNIGCKRSDIEVSPDKKTAIVISKHFFKVCIDDLNAELGTNHTTKELIKIFESSLSASNDNINSLPSDIFNYFYCDYVQEKNDLIKKWKILQKLNNIDLDTDISGAFNSITSIDKVAIKLISYELTEDNISKKDSEIYYFVNDFMDDEHKVPKEKNFMVFKFSESIKYKISSEKLKRPIEIFKIEPSDPFNTVARFHMPCVRAYLQGDTFYMIPSFITAMMTMINIDYKYFAGSRDPISIINKYMMRAYSLILNPTEKRAVLMYNMNIDTNNGMFKITNESQAFGTKELNSKIYKPGVYRFDLPQEIYNHSDHRYIKNINDLCALYQTDNHYGTDCPINILNFTAIGTNGSVQPIQQWVAAAYYEYINRENY